MNDIRIIHTPPKVFVVGVTQPIVENVEAYLAHVGAEWSSPDPLQGAEAIIEAAGRVCYGSWANKAGRTRREYIQEQIVGHKHGSVAEHPVANLMVADVDRATQLEICRHGDGTAFSWESQRFTDERLRFVVPPLIRSNEAARKSYELICTEAQLIYATTVYQLTYELREDGRYADNPTLLRKRAKEAARRMLPNGAASDGMVSVNGRALRWIIEVRSDEAADLSIREFAHAAFVALRPHFPHLLADGEEVAATDGPPQIKFSVSKV